MDRFTITEVVSIPSVVFALEYMLTTSQGVGRPLEFSLLMSMVAMGVIIRRNVKNGYIRMKF